MSRPGMNDFESEPDSEVQRYLLAEMDPAEVVAFESRLARDPDLCAAVGEGVSLLAAVSDMPATRTIPLRFGGIRPMRLVAAAVVLIGAAVALLNSESRSTVGTPVARSEAADARAESLLSLWLEADESTEIGADEDADLEFDTIDVAMGGADDEWDVPDWLLAGVREGR